MRTLAFSGTYWIIWFYGLFCIPQVTHSQTDTVFYNLESALKNKAQTKVLVLNGEDSLGISLKEKHFRKLSQLHTLIIHSWPLKSLPKSMASLSQLHHLELVNCKLDKIPEVIWQCKNLQTLNISCNQIKEVPAAIARLQQLKVLVLGSAICGGNPLTTLPQALTKLPCLTDLLISYTHFEKLPDLVGDLTHLKTLQMLHMKRLKELPNSLTKLKNLEVLEIHSYAPIELFTVPHSGWYRLRKLRLLYMNLPGLKTLPRAMFQLPYLQHLSLMGNRDLSQVSGQIRTLQSLEVLDVSFTQVKRLPVEIKQLPHLKQIRLMGTPYFHQKTLSQLESQLPGIEIVK
ncbi:MAG TPA: hypothetical protein DCS93_34455 [Microscillaceae bacterium]|nr:hypothetical protein [Microscillaceae bacterium]